MSTFAISYRYGDDAEGLAQARPAHREYLGSLLGAKGLIASGRTQGGEVPSALLVFEADSAEAVAELLNDDPFWTNGLIAQREILEWTIATGSLGGGSGS